MYISSCNHKLEGPPGGSSLYQQKCIYDVLDVIKLLKIAIADNKFQTYSNSCKIRTM